MSLDSLSTLFGGIGLFLLGMHLMTNGMKQAAGQGLKQALESATNSPLKGLSAGIIITALVQSSSAVTVATIGFVNAGLMKLRQSINVIYGCNIGTTMTGWLVALIGFKIKISAFALPLIGLGMLLKLLGDERRISHIGMALAGFGLFFIGLDFLKSAFEGLDSSLPIAQISHSSAGLLLFVLAGFVLTFLMQSSSAAMAITLSLTAAGSIPLASAGALVIGANLGTTSTAILSVIGATSNAKRIASAHVIFNAITGAIGILLLVLFSSLINQDLTNINLVILLAAFHTLFNVAGVAVMWPLTEKLVEFLRHRFRTQEDQLGEPQFLDKNVLESPVLAIEAMSNELCRVSGLTSAMARAAISADISETHKLTAQMNNLHKLSSKIGSYNQKIAQENLTEEISSILPSAMRITRYYSEIARLSALMPNYYEAFNNLSNRSLSELIYDYQSDIVELIDSCEITQESYLSGQESRKLIKRLEKKYQHLKAKVMETSIEGQIKPKDSIALLDALSHIHRLAEQVEKAGRYWSSITPMQTRDPLPDTHE
ncbi:Na/Pi cotransporter family protein [Neptuniibacter caesariensis]|uniref:Na+/Pi-cotransporter n=1 Tax=Neptuniibacter caesariensis TaxID=207954 RepID=A0A7U8C4Z9_NEPCE|nr:Na/Pi cotransporter family protein [Neptuniibacter caesariensis]EAR60841.1 Na+/Pi-cotransporter [Oceanospirillum sp. MED92] [Neptuniibacter caesariensis]